MKRILLPFFLFASAAASHPEQILVRHPQAEVNYYCQPRQTIDQCINVACSYATPYGCRVISQNQGVYYIETYIPPTYIPPVVVVPPPIVYAPPVFVTTPPVVYIPPIISFFSTQQSLPPHTHHNYNHRPRRR